MKDIIYQSLTPKDAGKKVREEFLAQQKIGFLKGTKEFVNFQDRG
jgi:hypothetical protein